VIERSLVRLSAGALSSQLGHLTSREVNHVPVCMVGVKPGCVHLCRVTGNTV